MQSETGGVIMTCCAEEQSQGKAKGETMLRIEIRTDNTAFKSQWGDADKWDDMYCRNEEVKRILKNVCNQLDNCYTKGSCIDINGNKVGEWSIN
jgi:hypothetical protein